MRLNLDRHSTDQDILRAALYVLATVCNKRLKTSKEKANELKDHKRNAEAANHWSNVNNEHIVSRCKYMLANKFPID